MTAVPGLESCSASAPTTAGASRDAGFGGRLVSQGGAVDSESAAIAMASLCRKAGLEFRPRSGACSQFGCMLMVMCRRSCYEIEVVCAPGVLPPQIGEDTPITLVGAG